MQTILNILVYTYLYPKYDTFTSTMPQVRMLLLPSLLVLQLALLFFVREDLNFYLQNKYYD